MCIMPCMQEFFDSSVLAESTKLFCGYKSVHQAQHTAVYRIQLALIWITIMLTEYGNNNNNSSSNSRKSGKIRWKKKWRKPGECYTCESKWAVVKKYLFLHSLHSTQIDEHTLTYKNGCGSKRWCIIWALQNNFVYNTFFYCSLKTAYSINI